LEDLVLPEHRAQGSTYSLQRSRLDLEHFDCVANKD
jgi:hypothetical protein